METVRVYNTPEGLLSRYIVPHAYTRSDLHQLDRRDRGAPACAASLCGLASGALREARALAQGVVVQPARMRDNLGITRGLLFADAAASRLGAKLGREAAHALVERAAGEVRETGDRECP